MCRMASPANQFLKVRKLLIVLMFLLIGNMLLNTGADADDSANASLSRTVTIGSRFEIDVSKIQVFNEFKKKPVVTVNICCKWKKLKIINSQKEFNDGVKKLIVEVEDTIPVGTYDLKISGEAKEVSPVGTDDLKLTGREVSVTFPKALTVAPLSIDSISLKNGGGGDMITITGKYFGGKPPKIWLRYDEEKNDKIKTQKVKCQVLTPLAYPNAEGNPGSSCMDVDTGNSKLTFQVPQKITREMKCRLFIDNTISWAGTKFDAGSTPHPTGACIVVDLTDGSVVEVADPPSDLLTNDDYKTTKMVLKKLPAGTFTMGSPESEIGKENYKIQESQHQVTLSKDFYVAVFECTQKQYKTVMGSNPSTYKGDKLPVGNVDWIMARGGTWPDGAPDASSFMGKLRKLTGKAFDLPTEAQWEYACRAGTTRAYNNDTDCLVSDYSKDTNLDPLAWYINNAYCQSKQAQEVGSKQANDWGLYDMHGNVWEWCLDLYVKDLGSHAVIDPVGASSGKERVKRGGGGNSIALRCRAAYRSHREQPDPDSFTGIGWGLRVTLPAGQ